MIRLVKMYLQSDAFSPSSVVPITQLDLLVPVSNINGNRSERKEDLFLLCVYKTAVLSKSCYIILPRRLTFRRMGGLRLYFAVTIWSTGGQYRAGKFRYGSTCAAIKSVRPSVKDKMGYQNNRRVAKNTEIPNEKVIPYNITGMVYMLTGNLYK